MKVVTANEMRQIDQQTIEGIGILGIVLMENAGRAVVATIQKHFSGCRRVAVVIGKGNNGGDGLVAARLIALTGCSVQIILVSPPYQFTGDALTNLQIAQNLNLPIVQALSETDLDKLERQISQCELIVDAIFGTGLRGAVRGFVANVIACINARGCPVVAIDLPSGLETDSGVIEGACVKATHTVTMGLPKRGLLLHPGADTAGQLEIANIGFPPSVIQARNIEVNWTRLEDAAKLIPPRYQNSHKGTYGRVFVAAASTGMTGAAALASEAAARVGAGLVTVGVPNSLNPVLEVKLTEAMSLPLPETDEGTLALDAGTQILEFIARNRSILAIGPGLSQHPETVALVHHLIRESDCPIVIDADGLNALAKSKELLSSLRSQTVLTPHPGEMARLIGGTVPEVERDRIGIAQQFAQEHNVTLVLKGVPTVIASGDGAVWVNSTGNPGMATGGMGDVLTGVVAGLMAQQSSSHDAAVLGVYLHGLAADIAAESIGVHGLMARDVLEALPTAFQSCHSSTSG